MGNKHSLQGDMEQSAIRQCHLIIWYGRVLLKHLEVQASKSTKCSFTDLFICWVFVEYSKGGKFADIAKFYLTLSWRRPLSYRNQSIDLLCKSMDWFLYDNGLRHERVNRLPPLYKCLQCGRLRLFFESLNNVGEP